MAFGAALRPSGGGPAAQPMTSQSTLAGAHDTHFAERAMLLKLFDTAVGSVSAASRHAAHTARAWLGTLALIAVGKAAAAMAM